MARNSRPTIRRRRHLLVEALEDRQLMAAGAAMRDGMLLVVGTPEDDVIEIIRTDASELAIFGESAGAVEGETVSVQINDLPVQYFQTPKQVIVVGDAGADEIYLEGLDADVSIQGGAGDDVIECVAGDSYGLLLAAEESDAAVSRQVIVTGDAGRDTVYVESANAKVLLRGGSDDDALEYVGEGIAILEGGPGNDQLNAGSGRDLCKGGSGNDVIDCNLGDDLVRAGAGNDSIYGGDGDDLLRGGPGNDYVEGGRGSDTLLGNAGDDILEASTIANENLGGGWEWDEDWDRDWAIRPLPVITDPIDMFGGVSPREGFGIPFVDGWRCILPIDPIDPIMPIWPIEPVWPIDPIEPIWPVEPPVALPTYEIDGVADIVDGGPGTDRLAGLSGTALIDTQDRLLSVEVDERQEAATGIAPSPLQQQTFEGTLYVGWMAIGGETTGVVLQTAAGLYELDFSADPSLLMQIQNYDGYRLRVTGSLVQHRGIEIPFRSVIQVTGFEVVSSGWWRDDFGFPRLPL